MALLFVDSFDHIASKYKWTNRITINDDYEVVPGREGLGALSSSGSYAWRLNPPAKSTVCVGAAFNISIAAIPLLALGNTMALVSSGPILGSGFRVELHAESDGSLTSHAYYTVFEFSGPRSASGVFSFGQWQYVEFWAHVYYAMEGSTVTGYVDVVARVDEQVVLSGTIVGYSASGPLFRNTQCGFTYISAQCGVVPYPGAVDDLYVTDGEMLGDVRIYVIRPIGNGDESGWDKRGAASLWQAVLNPGKELGAGIGSKAATVSTEDVGASFLVRMQEPAPMGKILGIQVNHVCRKDDSGSAAFKRRYEINGTIYESPGTIYPSYQSWYDRVDPMRLNPVTGEEWQPEDVKSIQAGARRIL
jgi:hypothetical protein